MIGCERTRYLFWKWNFCRDRRASFAPLDLDDFERPVSILRYSNLPASFLPSLSRVLWTKMNVVYKIGETEEIRLRMRVPYERIIIYIEPVVGGASH